MGEEWICMQASLGVGGGGFFALCYNSTSFQHFQRDVPRCVRLTMNCTCFANCQTELCLPFRDFPRCVGLRMESACSRM